MRENMGVYRGKRKENGEWVEGFYVGDTGDGCHEICDINSGTGHRVEVDPATVGQYTRLKDNKNGKRIFEGDILLLDDIRGFVNYGRGCFCVRMPHPDYLYRSNPAIDIVLNEYPGLEVIGNVHDNPELLEGTQK